MSKYIVKLYFSFGTIIATDNEQPDGDIRYFDSLADAENYGRSKNIVFEAVEASKTKVVAS